MKGKEVNLLEKIWVMLQGNSKELTKIGSHVAVLNKEMGTVKDDIGEIKERFVTKAEFDPVQKIVFGLVGLVLATIVGALLKLIMLG